MELEVSPKPLAKALEAVIKVADFKPKNPVYQNVLLEFTEGSLRAVGMNGFRLARTELPLPGPKQRPVISLENARAFVRALKKVGGNTQLVIGEGWLGLKGPSLQLSV